MSTQTSEPANTLKEVLFFKYVDLKQFSIRTILEPETNQIIHVYSAPKDRMVSKGDILYRINGKDNVRMYRVLYADTLRYPVSACTKVCSPLPYELFVRLEPITDEQELAGRYCEIAVDRLPH
ncbi:MAG: hypothetical protein AAF840_01890 [Bacteroidota bacterium]